MTRPDAEIRAEIEPESFLSKWERIIKRDSPSSPSPVAGEDEIVEAMRKAASTLMRSYNEARGGHMLDGDAAKAELAYFALSKGIETLSARPLIARAAMASADAEIAEQRQAIDRMLTGGNHLALYAHEWPAWQLDGLTREQQCESVLRVMGATKDYDLWCCYSEMLQARDNLEAALSDLRKARVDARIAELTPDPTANPNST